jgi:uncharacterized PurR-regulated membrane protein YhhQ (DUF165 family)
MKLLAAFVVSVSVLIQIVLFTAPDYFFPQGALLTLCLTLLSLGLFILTDTVNERWGPRVTAAIVTIGIFSQSITIIIALVMGMPYPAIPSVFLVLLGAWCGDILDTLVYAYVKNKTKERLLWLRVLLSTSCALLVDMMFFAAVVGAPLSVLVAPQLVWKFAALIASIPLVYVLHRHLPRDTRASPITVP